jgi:hypothetical protein
VLFDDRFLLALPRAKKLHRQRKKQHVELAIDVK